MILENTSDGATEAIVSDLIEVFEEAFKKYEL